MSTIATFDHALTVSSRAGHVVLLVSWGSRSEEVELSPEQADALANALIDAQY